MALVWNAQACSLEHVEAGASEQDPEDWMDSMYADHLVDEPRTV